MCRVSINKIIVSIVIALLIPRLSVAAQTDTEWARWFENQIEIHPEVIAAFELMNSSFSLADGLDRPLYNPEIGTEFEREGNADNYSIGINQTFDWANKRGIRKQQAIYSRLAAEQTYELILQQKKSEALQTIVVWQMASEKAELTRTLESQLETLLDLVIQRQQAGDLGLVDAELTFLNLSQRLNTTAQAQVELLQVEARLRELLPDWSDERAEIPADIWLTTTQIPANQWVDQHPVVMAAKSEWEVLQQSADLAQKATKPDPTFGLDAGETDQESLVRLTFSMPLYIRNNYSAEARAASQIALSAEAQYRAIRRRQIYSIQSAQSTLQEYQQRYRRWQDLMQGRDESSSNLLESQWNNGDLSTTEYLLALQQRADGLIAGIELRSLYELARINWLLQTGQIDDALKQL